MDIHSLHNTGPTQITISPAAQASGTGFFSGGDVPSFADLVDTVNPLQHIPIVSSIYRAVSGDTTPSAVAQLAGGALFGGPLGFLAGLADVIFEQVTGHDVGGAMVASLDGTGSSSSAEAVALANKEADTVHLGDFAGDVARSLRSRSYDQSQVAMNTTPQIAPQPQVAEIPVSNADPVVPVREISPADMKKNADIISLFGPGNATSVANAYKKADMLSTLMENSTNKVM